MPWNDIGVVLHDREDDLVALLDEGLAEGGSDQIDRFGRRFREDDLVYRAGVEEGAHAFPRRLIGFRRGIGEMMQTAMNIGVFVIGRVDHAVDDFPRFLRRRGIIEVNQRLAMDLGRKDWEILAQTGDIERRVHGTMFVHALLLSWMRQPCRDESQACTFSRNSWINPSCPMPPINSLAKPSNRSASASGRGKPLVCR